MYRFALSYLKSAEDAKDVVQDILLKLWEDRNRLESIDNLESWCMTLTKNRSLDRLKRAGNKRNTSISHAAELVSAGMSPLHVVSENDEMHRIKTFMDTLNHTQKEAFRLRDVEGYSYLEISEILEMNMNQVKVNIHRARKAIRSQLEKLHDYESR